MMNRRTLITTPVFLGAAFAVSRARGAQGCSDGIHRTTEVSLTAEEFMIPTDDPGVQLYLLNKRSPHSGPARPDRTVLFVHGLTFPASAVFDLPLQGRSWMDHIAKRGFDVWSVDIRGFGRSSRPEGFAEPASDNPPILDAATATRDLQAASAFIRERRGLPRLTILAWSWGTVLAARHASEHPELVERLVLYAPVWQWQGPEPPPPAPPGAYRSVTAERALEAWLKAAPENKRASLLPDGWFEQWAEAVWATDPQGAQMDPPVLRVPNGPLVEVAEHWKTGRTFFEPALITAPTQLVVAEWDRTTPPNQALALFPLLANSPGKRLVVLAEGTHSIFLERNRDALFTMTQSFLEEESL